MWRMNSIVIRCPCWGSRSYFFSSNTFKIQKKLFWKRIDGFERTRNWEIVFWLSSHMLCCGSQVEGRGNGIKTVLENIVDVARDIGVPPSCTSHRFFSFEKIFPSSHFFCYLFFRFVCIFSSIYILNFLCELLIVFLFLRSDQIFRFWTWCPRHHLKRSLHRQWKTFGWRFGFPFRSVHWKICPL